MDIYLLNLLVIFQYFSWTFSQDSGSFCTSKGELCKCDLLHYKKTKVASNEYGTLFTRLLAVCCQPGMIRLHLKGAAIRTIPPEVFTKSPCHEVQELVIKNTSILSLPSEGSAFTGLPNLKRLSVTNNAKLTRYPNAAFQGLNASLIELHLNDNPVTELDGREFSGLGGIRSRLKLLNLSRNRIAKVKPHAFNSLKTLRPTAGLNKLILDENRINSITPDMFTGLESLELLSLINNPVNTIFGGSFINLKMLKTLVISDLSMNIKKNDDLSTLTPAMLHGLSNLRELSLIGLGLETLQINTLIELRNLQELNLANNRFKEIPKAALERLGMVMNQQLSYINISSNEINCITNEAFKSLTYLEEVDLSNNLITIISDKAFVGLQDMQILRINGNPIRLMSPLAFTYLKSLEILAMDTLLDDALKNVRERFQTTALGLLSNRTKIRGLENMGIQHGGGAPIPQRFDSSIKMPDSECPTAGIAGVDFNWGRSKVAREDLLYLDSTFTRPDKRYKSNGASDKTGKLFPSDQTDNYANSKDKSSSMSFIKMLNSKKYLVIALVSVFIVILLVLFGVLIVYRVVAKRKADANTSSSRRGLANSEYGGSSAPKTCSETGYSNQYGYYCTNKDCSLPCCEYHSQTVGSKSPLNFSMTTNGNAKVSKKVCDGEIIPAAALQLAPPPYPQHARSPYVFNFGSTGSSSSASGTLVSNQKMPISSGPAGTLGSNGSATEPLLFSSPRTKSGSTDQTNMTPCTNSSLEGPTIQANMCIFPPSPSSLHNSDYPQSPPNSIPSNSIASNGNNTNTNTSLAQQQPRLITNLGVL